MDNSSFTPVFAKKGLFEATKTLLQAHYPPLPKIYDLSKGSKT